MATVDADLDALHESCETMDELLAGIRAVLSRHGLTDPRDFNTTVKSIFGTVSRLNPDGSYSNKWRRKFYRLQVESDSVQPSARAA